MHYLHSRPAWLLLICVVFGVCSIYFAYAWNTNSTSSGSGTLMVYFLDIGQGDASLIKTPENTWILIDTGPTPTQLFKALKKVPHFPNKIDLFLLTHPHKDHIGALSSLIDRMPIGAILYNGNVEDKEQEQVLTKAEKSHIPIYQASAGQDIQVGNQTILDILMVPTNEEIGDNLNNASLLVKLSSGKHSFLFAGDAEVPLEHEALSSGIDLDAEYLKGGHHGSSTSSSYTFLQAVSPVEVVFSNGKNNSFKHPHEEVLTRLKRMHIPYFNTSEHGTISYTCSYTSACSQYLERS